LIELSLGAKIGEYFGRFFCKFGQKVS